MDRHTFNKNINKNIKDIVINKNTNKRNIITNKKDVITKENNVSNLPSYRKITVKCVDGSLFLTRSTFSNNVMTLEIDDKTHLAWKEESFDSARGSIDKNVKKFQKRFEGISSSDWDFILKQ